MKLFDVKFSDTDFSVRQKLPVSLVPYRMDVPYVARGVRTRSTYYILYVKRD